jgi:hypothetical protein
MIIQLKKIGIIENGDVKAIDEFQIDTEKDILSTGWFMGSIFIKNKKTLIVLDVFEFSNFKNNFIKNGGIWE